MPTEEQIKEALSQVIDPELRKNIVELGMVRSIERHDDGWPAAGTRFEHTQGKWPVIIHDETESAGGEPARRLELIVKARPVLVAHVVLDLQPSGSGTRIVMEEKPMTGLIAPFVGRGPGAALTRLRNRVSLKRLARLAEGAPG